MMQEHIDHYIAAGDTYPIRARLFDEAGNPLAVFASTPVQFQMWDAWTKELVIDAVAEWEDAANALARYIPTAEQTTGLWGDYEAQFVITLAGGVILTSPQGGYLTIRVKRGGAA